ncbi:hypothetical protein IJ670_04820 [bacterium]|nr:hypothetical protein [bacterium]
MIKNLQFNGDTSYLYLSKPVLQLLIVNPNETNFIFEIKNKTLYISKISPKEALKYEHALIKKPQKNGSGYCIYIPKPILELIDVNPETDKVDFLVESQTIILKKASV